jgi:hypothetical protein
MHEALEKRKQARTTRRREGRKEGRKEREREKERKKERKKEKERQKEGKQAGCWWLMPVILATQKAKIRRIEVRSQPRQIVLETLSRQNPSQKGLVEWLKV